MNKNEQSLISTLTNSLHNSHQKLYLLILVIWTYSLKMLGCFNRNLGQKWMNPNVGLKM